MINFGGLVKLIKLHLAGKLGPYEENPAFEELGYASLRARWFCRQWFCYLPLEESFIHSGKKYSRTLEVLTARGLSCYVGDASNDLKRRWRLTTSHVYDIFIKL